MVQRAAMDFAVIGFSTIEVEHWAAVALSEIFGC
jgi:hypothetical protein